MITREGNFTGMGISSRRLDLLALPERKEDEPGEAKSECDSEPLVPCDHNALVSGIDASVQISACLATGRTRQNSPYSYGYSPPSKGDIGMLARDEDILKAAEDWRREGRGVALATVVETWGSAPRPVGSNLVIDKDGNFLGSVSGGCVEGAVVTEALEVIDSGKPKMLEFGVADETAWKVGLSCGGTIRVYVEKVE
jgi:hypothetical protein